MKEKRNYIFLRATGNRPLNIAVKILAVVSLAALCLSILFLLVWMVYTAFKPSLEYFDDAFALPKFWTFDNFKRVLPILKADVLTPRGEVVYGVWNMLLVSLVWAGVPTLVSLVYTIMTAYVISRYEFVGRKFLFSLGLVIMIVPVLGGLPSAMAIKRALGIYDNMLMHILISPGITFSGLTFLLFYAAFKRIPWDYAEAGFIDGAGHFRVMFTLMMPMVIPTGVALYVLAFVSTWNDFGTFILWMPSYANLAYGMYLFQNQVGINGATPPQIMAGFIMCMIPTIVLYSATQKLVLTKFTVGGLKG